MAIQREEERLGAFTLFGHLKRLLGFLHNQRRLLVLFMVLSTLQAVLEMALPLLVRQAIDGHILLPHVRVEAKDLPEILPDLEAPSTPSPDGQHLFIARNDLDRTEVQALEAAGALDGTGWLRLPGEGGFLSEQDLSRLPAERQQDLRQEDRSGIVWLALLYLGLLIVNFGLSYGVTYGLNHLGQRAVLRVRDRLWSRLLHLPVRYFDENPVGRLVTRVANDPANLSELFTSVLATALADVALFLGILGLLFWLDPTTTLTLLALAPAVLLLTLWFKRVSQRIYRVIRVQLAQLNTYIQESYSGLQVIRSFVHEGPSLARFDELNEDYYRSQVRLVHVFSVFRPAIDVFGTAAAGLVVWYTGNQALDHQVSLGTVVAFLLYLKMLFRPLQSLAEKFNILQSSVVSSERLIRILDTPEEPTGQAQTGTAGKRAIEFEGVSFGYDARNPVIRDVSFQVAKGEKVALVGPTGSGKTTLISLLLGYYPLDADGGAIRVQGRNLEDWDRGALRQNFALVQQDLFLFSGRLGDNVNLFGKSDPERLARSLQVSRLNRVLERLPDGLDHVVNERGTVLSQGERQLVSFARALDRGGDLLVLDEATSSVDSGTEALIQEALEDLLRDRTALIVAHRLSTVQSADRILVLNAGRIVERGTHAELLAKDGFYAHLYHTQLAGEPRNQS